MTALTPGNFSNAPAGLVAVMAMMAPTFAALAEAKPA